jgi:hypothetical protein
MPVGPELTLASAASVKGAFAIDLTPDRPVGSGRSFRWIRTRNTPW